MERLGAVHLRIPVEEDADRQLRFESKVREDCKGKQCETGLINLCPFIGEERLAQKVVGLVCFGDGTSERNATKKVDE